MTDKMREAYKLHRAKLAGQLIQGEDWPGAYRRAEELLSWSCFEAGWKASREALVIDLPAENPLGSGPGDCGDGRPSFEQHCAAECNFILRDCREAIEAAGLKVKQ
ncbi:MAG: hypothetical protein MUW57_21960 [Pseudomonas sp.]|nr:hypothetical protein [Pseudomonas sp.]